MMRYAGFWSRLWAMFVDWALLSAPAYLSMRLQKRWWLTVVLLFNRRKRALHDFIAGTVVIHTAPPALPDPDRLGILPMLDRR